MLEKPSEEDILRAEYYTEQFDQFWRTKSGLLLWPTERKELIRLFALAISEARRGGAKGGLGVEG